MRYLPMAYIVWEMAEMVVSRTNSVRPGTFRRYKESEAACGRFQPSDEML